METSRVRRPQTRNVIHDPTEVRSSLKSVNTFPDKLLLTRRGKLRAAGPENSAARFFCLINSLWTRYLPCVFIFERSRGGGRAARSARILLEVLMERRISERFKAFLPLYLHTLLDPVTFPFELLRWQAPAFFEIPSPPRDYAFSGIGDGVPFIAAFR